MIIYFLNYILRNNTMKNITKIPGFLGSILTKIWCMHVHKDTVHAYEHTAHVHEDTSHVYKDTVYAYEDMLHAYKNIAQVYEEMTHEYKAFGCLFSASK